MCADGTPAIHPLIRWTNCAYFESSARLHRTNNHDKQNSPNCFQKHCQTLFATFAIATVTLNGLDNSILVPDVSTYRGNSALFQCKIPPHLEDVIRPTGWLVADSGQQSAKLSDSLFIPISTTKGKNLIYFRKFRIEGLDHLEVTCELQALIGKGLKKTVKFDSLLEY